MRNDDKNQVRCHGCAHYFVTYDRNRPYGCAKFGFKTKSLPSPIVVESTGMQCAYRINRSATNQGRKLETRGKSDGR
jgi:hypothetical protein